MNIKIEEIKQLYEKTLLAVKGQNHKIKLKVEFYPYAGINNTIRLSGELIHVKISDVLQDAPLEFQQVLAEILIRKFCRKRVPAHLSQTFRDFLNQPEMREKSTTTRKQRGRKILHGAEGKHYNLEKIFDSVNQKYLQNSISKPTLTWSSNKTYRMLGRYDRAHHTITISKSLDEERVPPFVVMYVVFHEMLHIKHPTEYQNGRRSIHTPAFRHEEEAFELFDQAEEWIENEFAKGKRQKVKGKKSFLSKLLNF